MRQKKDFSLSIQNNTINTSEENPVLYEMFNSVESKEKKKHVDDYDKN